MLSTDNMVNEDLREEEKEPVATNIEPSFIAPINYYLNEIKSLEDTARQITAVCILMIGISLTLITNNYDNLTRFMKETLEWSTLKAIITPFIEAHSANQTSVSPVDMIIKFGCLLYFVVFLVYFILIWVIALDAARKALKLEPITANQSQYLKTLSDIANIKDEHCRNAINILIIGAILTSVLAIGLLLMQIVNSSVQIAIAIFLFFLFIMAYYAIGKNVDLFDEFA